MTSFISACDSYVEIQLTKGWKDLASIWNSVPRADHLLLGGKPLPTSLYSITTYSFQVPMNPSLPANLFYLKKVPNTFFFTPAYLSGILSCIWSSLSICKGVSGSSNPRRWCVAWLVYLRREADLVTRRHLVPGRHEEGPLLRISQLELVWWLHTLALDLLCLWIWESPFPHRLLFLGPGSPLHNLLSHMAPASHINSSMYVQAKCAQTSPWGGISLNRRKERQER